MLSRSPELEYFQYVMDPVCRSKKDLHTGQPDGIFGRVHALKSARVEQHAGHWEHQHTPSGHHLYSFGRLSVQARVRT